MTLVVTLTVRRDRLEMFRAFERHAAAVMAAHGGRIERTVVAPIAERADLLAEVHLVTFPSEAAFAAYQADPRLHEAVPLREASVVRTEVLAGEDGPDYAAG